MPRKSHILYFFILTLCLPLHSQSFNEFVLDVNASRPGIKQEKVNDFLGSVASFPIIESNLVTFIFIGDLNSVSLAGDDNQWNPEADYFTHLEGTNLWYIQKTYERNARLDYKFVMDLETWIQDPLNNKSCKGGFGENSTLFMPEYIESPYKEYDSTIAHGTFQSDIIKSDFFDYEYNVQIYLPPGYKESKMDYPLIVFHNGSEFIYLGYAANILDNLISRGKMEPVVAVFVDPNNRAEEYTGAMIKPFSSFVIGRLIPYLDYNYRIADAAADRCTFGISNGGNISLWLGIQYPEVFGKIGALSGNSGPFVQDAFETKDKQDLNIYLEMGLYDNYLIMNRMNDFVSVLKDKGYDFHFRQIPEGHSWCNWNNRMWEALEFLFPVK